MCGIITYIGNQNALPRLVDGLRRLEYRGYDSAGVALLTKDGLWVRKAVGRVEALSPELIDPPETTIGIAHTRWATHGGVTEPNAHPHIDTDGNIAVVHNGIIENMDALKKQLEGEGVVFRSETDTEILPHLMNYFYRGDPLKAFTTALKQVRGTYGCAAIFKEHPDRIFVARNGSPLVIGLGEGETVVASDPQAIVAHTRRVVYLEDREIAVVTRDGVDVMRLDGTAVETSVELIDGDYGVADRRGFPHFMLKEIHEQPESIERCLRGRLDLNQGNARLGGLNMSPRDLIGVNRVINVACGTAYHAGMVGAQAIEAMARVPARAEVASEYRYRHPIVHPDTLFFAVSQSGETADTKGAVEEILLKGGQMMGVVNVVGSTIARTCGRGTYIHAGPEVSVASTKAFTSQVTGLLLFTLMLARTKNLSVIEGQEVAKNLQALPGLVQRYLANPGPIDDAVERLIHARYALFLGRGLSFPVALEGALKLKEVAYVPCEAYPAGEMKHGPIAMIDEETPVVAIVPNDSQREKALSNLKEVEARGAKLIIIHTEGDKELEELATVSLPIPACPWYCSPIISVLPLQLLAYRAGVALGRDIDKPRNLAKSVTVE